MLVLGAGEVNVYGWKVHLYLFSWSYCSDDYDSGFSELLSGGGRSGKGEESY